MTAATAVFAANPPAQDDALLEFDGISDFCDPGLHSRIIGSAYLGSAEGPDIFLMVDRYYGNKCLLYEFAGYEAGIPVFRRKGEVALPEKAGLPMQVLQKDEDIYLFWPRDGKLNYAVYNARKSSFEKKGELALPGQTKSIPAFSVVIGDDGTLDVYFAKTTRPSVRPGNWRSADYRPYDAAGVYRGGLPAGTLFSFGYDSFTSSPSDILQLTETDAIPGNLNGVAAAVLNGEQGLVVTNNDGAFYFHKLKDGKASECVRIVDSRGNAMRNAAIGPYVCIYPSPEGNLTDFLISCEGGVFYMRDSGRTTPEGKLIYDFPVHAQEVDPPLYAGTLVTPTVTDWDNDGRLDIVVGNSAGYILFFKNTGTNEKPEFAKAEYLEAGGRTIMVQPGYGEDVQGPGEARWGYVGANVYDWNGDGYLDILTNDSRGKHMVYIGTFNGLEPEHPLYVGDLPLHGTWRCRPGIGVMDGKTVYVTLDDDDEFHLYFREDDYNLKDGYKLRLVDGRPIKANHLEAGGKGRVRFEITDWDGDGVKDLILATNKHNNIPAQDPDGLPWTNPKELQGSTILFMRNAGTEAEPKFEKPKQLKYKGELIRLGHHACGASVCRLGEVTDEGPNILVGDERGHIYLFERKYLTW